jgi:outer membrane biosynthesis protein TonB
MQELAGVKSPNALNESASSVQTRLQGNSLQQLKNRKTIVETTIARQKAVGFGVSRVHTEDLARLNEAIEALTNADRVLKEESEAKAKKLDDKDAKKDDKKEEDKEKKEKKEDDKDAKKDDKKEESKKEKDDKEADADDKKEEAEKKHEKDVDDKDSEKDDKKEEAKKKEEKDEDDKDDKKEESKKKEEKEEDDKDAKKDDKKEEAKKKFEGLSESEVQQIVSRLITGTALDPEKVTSHDKGDGTSEATKPREIDLADSDKGDGLKSDTETGFKPLKVEDVGEIKRIETGACNVLKDTKSIFTLVRESVEAKSKFKMPKTVREACDQRIKDLHNEVNVEDGKGFNDVDSVRPNTIDALNQFIQNTSQEDIKGVKDSQVFLGTLMSPILNLLPKQLIDWLATSLTDGPEGMSAVNEALERLGQ